jgi:hypothetical protein
MPSRAALNPCDNMNHRRRNAPVSHCPECGGVVNREHVTTERCDEPKHAAARRRQSRFCVDCGTQLIVAR